MLVNKRENGRIDNAKAAGYNEKIQKEDAYDSGQRYGRPISGRGRKV